MKKPIANKILIRKIVEPQTKSGLVLVNPDEVKPSVGEVVAIGEGTPKHPILLKEGDIILYRKNSEIPFENGLFVVSYQNVILKY